MPLTIFLDRLTRRENLSADEARDAFDRIFAGQVPAEQLAAFLRALHEKGETPDEIVGAARSMRAHAVMIHAPTNAIDIVGTGGDGLNTLNISTATCFVVAACGIPVAKHGNRAATSKAGSSDLLAALGVNLDLSVAALERCLAEANLCFLFAPRHHPAMRHVAEVRRKLGIRTIFNLLGPLTNPADVTRHLIGVYDRKWLKPTARALRTLGSVCAWVVHGHDGMDELSTTGTNEIAALENGVVSDFKLEPGDVGLPLARLNDLRGGDAAVNGAALVRLLDGEPGPYHDIVVLNAAAALIVAGRCATIKQAAATAADALDSGAARATLTKLIALSRQETP